MDAEIRPTVDKKAAGEYFFKIGLALVLLRVLTTGLQLGIQYLILGIDPDLFARLANGPWFSWVLSDVPLYAVALPTFWLALPKKTEKYKPEKMSFGNLLGSVAACFPLMYAGSFIGLFINEMLSRLSGNEITNDLSQVINSSPLWLVAIFTVIIAPIGEELIFRKLLIDRMAPFGELQAVIFSGLAFGLFHGNFHQFFYAFFIGALFAYVYIKTKNIVYPIIMHAVVNFVGSVLSIWAMGGLEKFEELSLLEGEELVEALTPEVAIEILPVLIFSEIVGSLIIGGIVYTIIRARKVRFEPAKLTVEGGNGMALWSNPAIITAVAVMLLTFILYLI